MSEIAIDISLLELGEGKNPFDELASKIERLSLEGSQKADTSKLEETLLFIERKFQDLQDVDQRKAKVLMQAVNANILMLEAKDFFSIDLVSRNLEHIKDISIGLSNFEINDTESYMLGDIIRHNNGSVSKISIYDLNQCYNTVFNRTIKKIANKTEWLIELNFETSKVDNHKPLEFINTFIEGLNTIPGVQVVLEDILIGSIQAKVKVTFDDEVSKEEAKEVLEGARQFAKNKLEVEYPEFEKSNSETLKNNTESELLQDKLLYLRSDENKEFRKLENDSLRYDVERKRLENEKLKLQVFKERKELLKELLSDGFISQKEMELLIKGISFIKIENGKLFVGENISVIDKL